jgi:type I restriction enzyme M protein
MKYEIDNKAGMIWSIADKLTGSYKPHEYGLVILPFTVINRLGNILKDTNDAVAEAYKEYKDLPSETLEELLKTVSGHPFYNISGFTLETLLNSPKHLSTNLRKYIDGFSKNVRDILDKFDITTQIDRMEEKNILFEVLSEFASSKNDLSPDKISDIDMGYIFEEIVRRFSESYGEDAGQHYTPREVIRLMSALLFRNSDKAPSKGMIKSVYDPACGTGGMLSVTQEYLSSINKDIKLIYFGQELNDETYAICKANMLIKGSDVNNGEYIRNGNTLSDDKFPQEKFDYIISNPPFGREWKIEKAAVLDEARRGAAGRFSIGTPAITDSQMLFLSAAYSKMKSPEYGGGRVAIVHNGSPLFTGDASSGPSDIRKYLIENDILDTIIALPEELFYNTGIATYVWILDNNKPENRKGKVQLIDASKMFTLRRKSIGKKRVDVTEDCADKIIEAYESFTDGIFEIDGKICESKILNNIEFGYTQITVESPLIDELGEPILKKGKLQPDSDKRDTENVPLNEDIDEYFKREVLPFNPQAWIDRNKTKVGYGIPFTRYFYKYVAPRSSDEILAEIHELENEISNLMKELR